MVFPKLPAKAAYLVLDNLPNRNALSAQVLGDLRQQLLEYNTPSGETAPLLLPDFRPDLLDRVFRRRPFGYRLGQDRDQFTKYNWLKDVKKWRARRGELPQVLVLRSEGLHFSDGGDQNFSLCAEVMSLIRQSPIPVVGAIQGRATAAGAQLALATDLPVAVGSARFQLPGMSIGLPCISASAVLSRKLGNAFTYRMFALGEAIRADELPAGVVEIVTKSTLDERVLQIADQLANQSSAQALAQAMGKWAYWTQVQIPNYSVAARWAAMAMTVPARIDDPDNPEEKGGLFY